MVSTQAKRKKTADMPDSPPKRVTRARAAKVVEDLPTGSKTTKITTASRKAAVGKKTSAAAKKISAVSTRAAAPSEPTKRKTRADDEKAEASEVPAVEEPASNMKAETQSAKSKEKQKEPIVVAQDKTQMSNGAKGRSRQPKVAAASRIIKPEGTKTRSRPKRVAEAAPEQSETRKQTEKKVQDPVSKAVRGRTAGNTTNPTATTATAKPAAKPSLKRVKFEEGLDKENVPISTSVPRKSAMKPAGLNAKPIRKPAAVRSTTRGKKAIPAPEKPLEETKKHETMPLSPKKVVQVARSDPISEDELAGEKTPVRALSKSPTKRLVVPINDIDGVSKLDFDQHIAPSSPSKFVPSSVLASPARRPPPSPFKNTLKSSPKKLDFGEGVSRPALLSSNTPKKSSLLQESPKRGVFTESAMKPFLRAPTSALKASLLQSPARRPQASPMKSTLVSSPEKPRSTPEVLDDIASNDEADLVGAMVNSPQKSVSTPLKATKSPDTRENVHKIAAEPNNDSSAVHYLDAEREGEAEPSPIPQNSDADLHDSLAFENAVSTEQTGVAVNKSPITESLTLPQPPSFTLAPAFSLGSSSLRRFSMESESSEDELASPRKIYEFTPGEKSGILTKDVDASVATTDKEQTESNNPSVSFTPLAAQLSSWNASSPPKRNQSRQARGMFSLGMTQPNMSPEQSFPGALVAESPAKTSFFDDEMALRDDPDISQSEMALVDDNDLAALQTSQDSQASEEYGDENAEPKHSVSLKGDQLSHQTVTCTPAKVFTPAVVARRPQEVHTVSKVPLRPSAEDTPLILPRQRSRSFGGPLATVCQPKLAQLEDLTVEQPSTPVLAPPFACQTPSSGMTLEAETPARTIRKGVVPDVLKGAVVHVDVHTTEGADASGIFVDLLTQMGARCVKQWHWNPRASIDNSSRNTASPQEATSDASVTKIGITHVVYKDGGKRTLEKVRSSNGVVQCVGVGWVLE